MAQSIVGGAISGLVALGSIRKQAAQIMKSKPVSSTPLWPLHELLLPASCWSSHSDILRWWTVLWKCKQNRAFSPQLTSWPWCFIAAVGTQSRTYTLSFSCRREREWGFPRSTNLKPTGLPEVLGQGEVRFRTCAQDRHTSRQKRSSKLYYDRSTEFQWRLWQSFGKVHQLESRV